MATPEYALKLAVTWKDSWGIDYIIQSRLQAEEIKQKLIKQYSLDLLITSYHADLVDVAGKLIKTGFNFKGEYLLYLSKNQPIINVIQHLDDIKSFISPREYYTSNQIIASYYADPIRMIHDSLCLDYPNIALSITYTSNPSYNNKFLSIYKSLYDNNKTHDHSVLIKDIISAIGADNYMMHNIKIVVPIIENLIEENGFYDNKRKLIYLPFYNFDFKEQSIFIHEASHYLMHDLFKNDGKPFPPSDNKTMHSYEKAAMNSLLSIASIVGFKYENGLPLVDHHVI